MPVVKTHTIAIDLPPNTRVKHLAFISGVIQLKTPFYNHLDDFWERDWIPSSHPQASGMGDNGQDYPQETYLVGPDWETGSLSTYGPEHQIAPITVLGSFDGDGDHNGWAVDDWVARAVDSDVNPGAAQRIQLVPKLACLGDRANVNRLSFFITAKGTILEPKTVGL